MVVDDCGEHQLVSAGALEQIAQTAPDGFRPADDLVGLALSSLNGMQVPASAVIGLVPLRLLARSGTSYLVAAAIVAALATVLLLPGIPLVLAAGVFGFCGAYILVLSFALPALLAAPAEVARMSAGAFAISYTTAFLVTLVTGAVWDATRVEASAFLPAVGGAVVLAALGPRLVSAAASAAASGSSAAPPSEASAASVSE